MPVYSVSLRFGDRFFAFSRPCSSFVDFVLELSHECLSLKERSSGLFSFSKNYTYTHKNLTSYRKFKFGEVLEVLLND